MSGTDINQFKGHAGSAFHSIFIAAGATETAVAAERDKFKLSAERTAIHGAAKGRIAAVNHLINFPSQYGMKGIFNFNGSLELQRLSVVGHLFLFKCLYIII